MFENILNNVKDGTFQALIDFFSWCLDKLSELCNSLVNLTFNILATLLLHTDYIGNNEMFSDVSKWMTNVSLICIVLIFVWNAFKLPFSSFSITKSYDFKTMMERLIVAFMLCFYTKFIVDLLIRGNNVLIDTLMNYFTLSFESEMNMNKASESFINIIITIVIVYLGCKLIIFHYTRIAEIWLYATLYPATTILWVDPSKANYMNRVVSKLITLIYTQFGHCLVWVLFSIMIKKSFATGNFNGAMISLSMLLMMLKVPGIIAEFQGKPNNSFGEIKNHYNGMRSKGKRVRGKVSNWIKKR